MFIIVLDVLKQEIGCNLNSSYLEQLYYLNNNIPSQKNMLNMKIILISQAINIKDNIIQIKVIINRIINKMIKMPDSSLMNNNKIQKLLRNFLLPK